MDLSKGFYLQINVFAIETSHDFNECSRENGRCDQSCHNTLESYFCSCWKGYRLGDDQHTCEGFLKKLIFYLWSSVF